MKKFFKAILGTAIILCGLSLILFGANLLIQQQTWLLLGGFITFAAIGYSLVQLGYTIARGGDIQDSLVFLFFLGNRTRR